MKWQDEKRLRMLAEDDGEDAVEIRRGAPINRSKLDAQDPRDRLQLPIAEHVRGIGRVPYDGDPGDRRDGFLEHLKRLPEDL